ncbi:Uncharacterized protein BM_BM8626 [Brugia malayi]|uniref:Uncharacterized protein n=1 Tax=Brugia malayi TaxID=6279 RepID=A0A4E9ERY8_BRUMA|nr:Uncharacterized protein BM_BM8626 [Brugia malayi]VIO85945.1 Uncharacterized protein BM_BM8626 [Brugia malayi]
MLNCDCSTCKPPSKFFRSHELEYQNDVTVQVASTSIKVAETSSMLMNLDYESAQQSEATAEEKKLIESVKSQMTGKPEMETANIGHCGHYDPVLFSPQHEDFAATITLARPARDKPQLRMWPVSCAIDPKDILGFTNSVATGGGKST